MRKNSKLNSPYIGNQFEAPDFTVDNPHLYLGYRINYNSFKLALSIEILLIKPRKCFLNS